MVNFKIGDVVRVLGKPETLRTIVGVPLKYATLPFATSPSRVWLDNGGWVYITELELVDVDDPLPPAPESGLYFNHNGTRSASLELAEGVIALGMNASILKVRLTPETALDLAYDLRRMAMEIRRKERNGN